MMMLVAVQSCDHGVACQFKLKMKIMTLFEFDTL